MKSNRTVSFPGSLAFALLLATSLPGVARAQASARGTFTLPFAVRWGGAVLPPGDYNFSIDAFSPTTVLQVHKEDGRFAGFFIMTHGWDQMPGSSAPNQLVLDSRGGEVFVKELQLGSMSTVLYYPPPKFKEKLLTRSSPPGRVPSVIRAGLQN